MPKVRTIKIKIIRPTTESDTTKIKNRNIVIWSKVVTKDKNKAKAASSRDKSIVITWDHFKINPAKAHINKIKIASIVKI